MSRVVVIMVLLLGGCSSAGHETAVDPGAVTTSRSAHPPVSDPAPSRHGTLASYSPSVRRLGPALRGRLRYSHGPGCPVPLRDLRYLRTPYVGFDGLQHLGELVVHEDYAEGVATVFAELYEARWPIRRMRLVDDYRGDDYRSMAANNTSAYNCRRVAGRSAWSAHAYGAAVDVNPVQNPYVTGSFIEPPTGSRYVSIDRSAHAPVPPGVIRNGDLVVRAFARIGWEWGGEWSTSKDYQHFSASGG